MAEVSRKGVNSIKLFMVRRISVIELVRLSVSNFATNSRNIISYVLARTLAFESTSFSNFVTNDSVEDYQQLMQYQRNLLESDTKIFISFSTPWIQKLFRLSKCCKNDVGNCFE